MTVGLCEDCVLLYYDAYIDPSQPFGLWWCKDIEDVEVIKVNAICKSRIASWNDLAGEEVKQFLEQFPYIFVVVPDEAERQEIISELSSRFSIPIVVPLEEHFYGAPSIKELYAVGGQKALDKLLYGAVELPIHGLINIADVDCEKRLNAQRVLSGFRDLDVGIGGFNPGDLTVWTGKRGEGKSTLLGQVLLEAINQVRRVCVYSGEMPKRQFKLSLLQQAAGFWNVTKREDDRTGHIFWDVKKEVISYIDKWWDRALFLTDIQCNNAHNEDTIIKLFEYAHRRYGCDIFLVDNIMTAELKGSEKLGYYQAQSAFTGRLVSFAKAHNVHVHLVAHPRKTDKRIEADDVGGSSDITNRADNVIKVERIKDENKDQAGCSMILTVLKNREFGATTKIKMDFDERSRRFYQIDKHPSKKYIWESLMNNGG